MTPDGTNSLDLNKEITQMTHTTTVDGRNPAPPGMVKTL